MSFSHDEWKLRSPWEVIANIETQHKTISALVNLLDECSDAIDELLVEPTAEARAKALALVSRIEGIEL